MSEEELNNGEEKDWPSLLCDLLALNFPSPQHLGLVL